MASLKIEDIPFKIYFDHNVLIRFYNDLQNEKTEELMTFRLLFRSNILIPVVSSFNLYEIVNSQNEVQVFAILKIIESFEKLHVYDFNQCKSIPISKEELWNVFIKTLILHGNDDLFEKLFKGSEIDLKYKSIRSDLSLQKKFEKINSNALTNFFNIEKGVHNNLTVDEHLSKVKIKYLEYCNLESNERFKLLDDLFAKNSFEDDDLKEPVDVEVLKYQLAEMFGYRQKNKRNFSWINSYIDNTYVSMSSVGDINLFITQDRDLIFKINKNTENGLAINLDTLKPLVNYLKSKNHI